MKSFQVFSSFLAMLAISQGAIVRSNSHLGLAKSPPEHSVGPITNRTTAVERRQSATCFPKTLSAIAGSQTMSYGLLNVTAAVRGAFTLCDDNNCFGSNTLLTYEGDATTEYNVQVSASGEYSSPAVRDMLLSGLLGLSWAGVTTSTDKGNVMFTGPSSFNVQLQCGGVSDSITLTMSAGTPAAGDCPTWVGAATDFIWDAINEIPFLPLGGIIAGLAEVVCSSVS